MISALVSQVSGITGLHHQAQLPASFSRACKLIFTDVNFKLFNKSNTTLGPYFKEMLALSQKNPIILINKRMRQLFL